VTGGFEDQVSDFFGGETKGRWLDGSSMVVAFLPAVCRERGTPPMKKLQNEDCLWEFEHE
jgi:hypothetical protein